MTNKADALSVRTNGSGLGWVSSRLPATEDPGQILRFNVPLTSDPGQIQCAVDMAAAQSFGTALEASVNGARGGAARLDTSTTQALIRLTERMVTIQYLRDGLYQACQAYANGAITSTTYSLILGGIDETLATTMMAATAAGTVRAVNAAVGAGATSSGNMPSGASGPGTADQPASETGNFGESGGASLQSGSTVAARRNHTATATLPQTTTITMPPNAGVAVEIARMHAAFINDVNFDSLMLASVVALSRPQIGGASFETDLSWVCPRIVITEWLTVFSETSDRRVIALTALELASSQARALDAVARTCAPGGNGEVCKGHRVDLPSGPNRAALVQQVLSG